MYLLDGKYALVETVDVITPVVNDPFTYGSISAANSLSDVYAMGGKPLTALAIIGFSSCDFEPSVIKEILRGALHMLDAAGVTLMGGHSFEDSEIKFGLSVTGLADRNKILRVQGANPGDLIVITKPIGVGVVTTALKGGKISEDNMADAVNNMLTLNNKASGAALNAGATSGTDVTGFGLLGHAFNMVRDSSVDFVIDDHSVPVLEGVRDLISCGMSPQGAYNNLKFLNGKVDFTGSISDDERLLLSDPQTSGGLLITVPEENMEKFNSYGIRHWVIGRVVRGSGKITVTK